MGAIIRYLNTIGEVDYEIVNFPIVFKHKDYNSDLRYVVGTNIELSMILSITVESGGASV